MNTRDSLKQIAIARRINATVKELLQEWTAARSLRTYERRVCRDRLVVAEGEDLREALRARIASRWRAKPPRKKGDLHIFLAYPFNNWEAVLPLSFEPFGRVSTFEWRSAGFDDLRPDWPNHRDDMNRRMLEAFETAHREVPIDAVVGYLSGHDTSPETLRAMASRGTVIFNFCYDDKLNFPGPLIGGRYTSPAAIASSVDLNLTNAPTSIAKYAVHGGLALFCPGAAHPDIHRPYDVSFDFDVSFVGACYGWRPQFIDRLRTRGLDVACFGPGWPGGALTGEDMVRTYSRSRINIGFGGVAYSRRLKCIKGRDFEVPMSGGLYLTQDNYELGLVFEIGREIVTYRDEGDCARVIRELLRNPDLANRIRQAGRARCRREHTYEARWTRVFEIAGLLNDGTAESPRLYVKQP